MRRNKKLQLLLRQLSVAKLWSMNALQKAYRPFGSRSKFAAQLGVSGEAVRKWERGRVPAERCIEIERITEGSVTRCDLRPDLFCPERHTEHAA